MLTMDLDDNIDNTEEETHSSSVSDKSSLSFESMKNFREQMGNSNNDQLSGQRKDIPPDQLDNGWRDEGIRGRLDNDAPERKDGNDSCMADEEDSVVMKEPSTTVAEDFFGFQILESDTGMSVAMKTSAEKGDMKSSDGLVRAEDGTAPVGGGSADSEARTSDAPLRSITDSPVEETGRTLRRCRKRTLSSDGISKCPICGCLLRPEEMERHVWWEADKLGRIGRGGRKSAVSDSRQQLNGPHASSSSTSSDSPHQTYQRVRANRQARLAAHRNRRRASPVTSCPVCNQEIQGTSEELNQHVELCLTNQVPESDDEMVDVEGEDTYEEYTWAGQTRVRATTMIPGGLAGVGFASSSSSHPSGDDGDVDLNVEDDDEPQCGQLQYNEADLIVGNEEKDTKALRKAFLKTQDNCPQAGSLERSRWEPTAGPSGNGKSAGKQDENEGDAELGDVQRLEAVIACLKEKLQDQQQQLDQQNIPKCLICMEAYVTPLTSIQCWHVHCEECWLRTLGTKKLCPQCNMITSPADLRRIYL